MAYDETLAQRVRRVVNGPDIEERKMFGGLAFMANGRMCCGVVATDLMVRVPRDAYEQIVREAHVRPMDFTGRPLKGFVYVSAEGVTTTDALRRWIAMGRRVAAQAGAAKATPTASTPKRARRPRTTRSATRA